jgi:hypothetical protein
VGKDRQGVGWNGGDQQAGEEAQSMERETRQAKCDLLDEEEMARLRTAAAEGRGAPEFSRLLRHISFADLASKNTQHAVDQDTCPAAPSLPVLEVR